MTVATGTVGTHIHRHTHRNACTEQTTDEILVEDTSPAGVLEYWSIRERKLFAFALSLFPVIDSGINMSEYRALSAFTADYRNCSLQQNYTPF